MTSLNETGANVATSSEARTGAWAEIVDRVKQESRIRGWLFSVVTGWCVAMGVLCAMAGILAGLKGLWGDGASMVDVVRMLAVAAVILLSTLLMWRLSPWGRNVAIVTVACVSWVMGEAISRKTGIGMSAQVMTIVFVAMSMACFTGLRVRDLFAAGLEEDEDEHGKAKHEKPRERAE